jgi:ribosomal protein L31E
MLVYHPALDPYHCVARLIKLIQYPVQREMELDRVRIIDFYMVFPAWIRHIRVPTDTAMLRNKVSPPNNPYYYSGRRPDVFRQMQPLQVQAFSLLAGRDLISADALSAGRWLRGRQQLPTELRVLAEPTDDYERGRLAFLVDTLFSFPVAGPNGLKHRTGLLEYRYDAA